jgi:REP element-mobilizing transposase RayT
LGESAVRYSWDVLSYCLMDTHWHLLVRTPEPTLSNGMRRLNSCYSRGFNRRHGRSGHSIRHRFMSVAVEDEAHLFELTRYLLLNPVRGGLIRHPEAWIVGYERGAGLDVALASGFAAIGPLRVWNRNHARV